MIDHSHRSRTIATLLTDLFRSSLLAAFVVTSPLFNAAKAAEPETASADVAMVRPLIMERTIVVAKFEPKRIALPEMGDVIEQESSAGEVYREREKLIKNIDSLRSAVGDQPIYATFGIPMSKEDRPFFFVLEDASKVDRPLLLDHLRIAGPEVSARERDGKLIIAPVNEERIDVVLAGLNPAAREELLPAFEAVSSYPVQVLVLPPDYLRRTVNELVPQLPEELGGGPSQVLTEGIVWAAFGIDPAELRAEFVIQSASEAAAERLMEYLPSMLKPGTLLRNSLEARLGIDPSTHPQEFESWVAAVSSFVDITREGDQLLMRLKKGKAGSAALHLLAQTAFELRDRLRQSDHSNKFKQILLAMHNYHDVNGMLPPADKHRDDEGKSPLSWRVHLLPFLDEAELFEQFRLDEPWDSPHNLPLLDKMPEIFASRSTEKPGQTTFLAPIGEDTVFGGGETTRFQNITDGLSNTVVLVEVEPALAVPWTAPRDYAFDPESPGEGLQLGADGEFLAAMGDGSVQRLTGKLTVEMLLRLFRKSDRKPIDLNAVR